MVGKHRRRTANSHQLEVEAQAGRDDCGTALGGHPVSNSWCWAVVLCALRLLRGPAAQDRVLALDTLWMCAMILALVLGIDHGSQST